MLSTIPHIVTGIINILLFLHIIGHSAQWLFKGMYCWAGSPVVAGSIPAGRLISVFGKIVYLYLPRALVPRESPIQDDRNGDECIRSGKLYEASGAGRNTAQRLGKYGRRMDPCAKIEAGARIHVSEGMVKDVTVMKYEENG